MEDFGSTRCQTHRWCEMSVNPTATSPSSVFPSIARPCQRNETHGKVKTATSKSINRILKGHPADFIHAAHFTQPDLMGEAFK